jgi:hypothetical protein
VEACPIALVRRKAYPNAASKGLSVMEHQSPIHITGLDKARDEFASLVNHLFPPSSL